MLNWTCGILQLFKISHPRLILTLFNDGCFHELWNLLNLILDPTEFTSKFNDRFFTFDFYIFDFLINILTLLRILLCNHLVVTLIKLWNARETVDPLTCKYSSIIYFLNFSLTVSQKSYRNDYTQNKNYNKITIFILMDFHYCANWEIENYTMAFRPN